MKRLLFIACLFISVSLTAQKHDTLTIPDVPNTDVYMKEQLRKMDSANTARSIQSMNNNMTSFMNDLSERREKEKRQLWIRFGLFGLTLVLVIANFVRRRNKKKAEENKIS